MRETHIEREGCPSEKESLRWTKTDRRVKDVGEIDTHTHTERHTYCIHIHS